MMLPKGLLKHSQDKKKKHKLTLKHPWIQNTQTEVTNKLSRNQSFKSCSIIGDPVHL